VRLPRVSLSLLALASCLSVASAAHAQQPQTTEQTAEQTQQPAPDDTPDHWINLDLPEGATSRDGSGTSWMPDSSPVFGHHFMAGDWMFMLHYSLIAGFDDQWSNRGSSRFLSTNWLMGMASHPFLGGVLTFRAMLSGEPATAAGPDQTPELLQSGETYGGQPLHDKQHPHDFFMETALLYRHPIAGDLGFELYAAPSGEPALGPTAFMHRLSAMFNPFAPIGHHWQDSTHISFPVVTAGLFNNWLKIEGSAFYGREPDENRWDFDIGPLDSWAGRLSINPTNDLSLQVSYGYLHGPEAIDPLTNEHRLTASLQYAADHGAMTLVWGRKIINGTYSDSLLGEAELDVDGKSVAFLRAEWVQKTAADLDVLGNGVYDVTQLVIGYTYRLPRIGPVVPFIGAAVDVGFVFGDLVDIYGTQNPTGAYFFFGVQPPRMPIMKM
jgi:hypothetical protein